MLRPWGAHGTSLFLEGSGIQKSDLELFFLVTALGEGELRATEELEDTNTDPFRLFVCPEAMTTVVLAPSAIPTGPQPKKSLRHPKALSLYRTCHEPRKSHTQRAGAPVQQNQSPVGSDTLLCCSETSSPLVSSLSK